MRQVHRYLLSVACSALLMGATTSVLGHDVSEPGPGDIPQSVLAAMNRTSTWGHPDQYAEFAGVERYAAGNYQDAMKYFLVGARFADKFSQLSIGLMYLNGQGVTKDPVAAFAWTAIAAERKYPQFLATRDAIWAQLDAPQRKQATALVEKLYAEYGDPVAKWRMTMRLRWARTQFTGSLLGFGTDSVSSMTPAQFFNGSAAGGSGMFPECGGTSIGGAPITGCGNLYVAWRWDAKQYFAARDAEWTGTVKVGALQSVNAQGPSSQQPDKQK